VNKIEQFKIYLGECHLKSKLKSFKRKSRFFNLDNAKTAGILFSNPDEQSFEAIKEFAILLKSKNISVTALGYIPGKKIPDKFLLHSNINFFSNNDLNWYYIPKNVSLNKFMNNKFDLLFDLSTNIHFPLHFVSVLSNASFKIGLETKENSDYDLMFNIEKNKSVNFLIEQIKHYLAMINNKGNE